MVTSVAGQCTCGQTPCRRWRLVQSHCPGLDEALARHPSSRTHAVGANRPERSLSLVQALDECPRCEQLGAEICDDCAHLVLEAVRQEPRQTL